MNLFQLGQSLKDARFQQQLTQSELAAHTGISLSTISGLERGVLAEIGVVKLVQLFAAVGLELQARPAGQRRTLDDARLEQQIGFGLPMLLQQTPSQFVVAEHDDVASRGLNKKINQLKSTPQKTPVERQRVRHSKKRERHE